MGRSIQNSEDKSEWNRGRSSEREGWKGRFLWIVEGLKFQVKLWIWCYKLWDAIGDSKRHIMKIVLLRKWNLSPITMSMIGYCKENWKQEEWVRERVNVIDKEDLWAGKNYRIVLGIYARFLTSIKFSHLIVIVKNRHYAHFTGKGNTGNILIRITNKWQRWK